MKWEGAKSPASSNENVIVMQSLILPRTANKGHLGFIGYGHFYSRDPSTGKKEFTYSCNIGFASFSVKSILGGVLFPETTERTRNDEMYGSSVLKSDLAIRFPGLHKELMRISDKLERFYLCPQHVEFLVTALDHEKVTVYINRSCSFKPRDPWGMIAVAKDLKRKGVITDHGALMLVCEPLHSSVNNQNFRFDAMEPVRKSALFKSTDGRALGGEGKQ